MIWGPSQLVKYGAAGGSSGCSMWAAVGSSVARAWWYWAREMYPWWNMSDSTTSRRALAALGKATGLNADGLATIPASSAASAGDSSDEHDGSGGSPQPLRPGVVDPLGV